MYATINLVAFRLRTMSQSFFRRLRVFIFCPSDDGGQWKEAGAWCRGRREMVITQKNTATTTTTTNRSTHTMDNEVTE